VQGRGGTAACNAVNFTLGIHLTGATGNATVPGTAPSAPGVLPPASNALVTTVPADGAIVAGSAIPFAWSAYPRATAYYLQLWLLRLAPGQALTITSRTIASARLTGTRTTFNAAAMPEGTYRWRMVAVGTRGQLLSGWSQERDFTLQ
jgi:hypothetical protein